MSEYWRISLEGALDRCEISATREQIAELAERCEGIASVEGQYTGHDLIEDPRDTELAKLRKALAIETAKRVCPECKGVGSFRINGPSHYSDHACRECGGRGVK